MISPCRGETGRRKARARMARTVVVSGAKIAAFDLLWRALSAANALVSSIHVGAGTHPAVRNISQSPRAVLAASFRRTPSGFLEDTKRQPAMSATSPV